MATSLSAAEAQAATTGLTRDQIADRANQIVPPKSVVTSNGARDQVYNAANTLAKAESGVPNPSLNRIQEQVFSMSKAIQDVGGSLSPDEQKLYDSIASLSGKSMGAVAGARSALDGKQYKDAVGGADEYNSFESQRANTLNQLLQSLSTRTSDIQTISKLFGQTPEEQETTKAINSTKSKLRSNDASALAGQVTAEGQPIPMPFITGQQAQIQKLADLKRIGLSNELAGYVDLLNSQVATRQQKLDAAKFVFDANRQSLSDTLTVYKELAPQNIGTTVDEFTGEMTVVMRNPLTGQTYKENLGQVATPKKWQDNIAFAKENNVAKPFYMTDGRTVINSNTGREYETVEQYLADGGVADFSNVQPSVTTWKQREMAFEQEKFGFQKSLALDQLALDRQQLEMSLMAAQGLGGLTKEQRAELNRIQDNVRQDPDIKNFIEIRDGYERIETGAELASGPGDLAMLFGYMKMLDPTSVVRETEFANAESALGYAQRILNIPSKFLQGTRLTEEGRQFYVTAAQRLYQTKEVQYEKALNFYSNQLNTFGIPTDLGVRDFGSSSGGGLESLWNGTAGSESPPVDINAALKSGGLTVDGASSTVGLKASPVVATFASAYPPGATGGECGVFARKLVESFGYTYPRVGNSLAEKTRIAQANGSPANQWRPGTVLITNESRENGHVAVINAVTSKGYQVTESNYGGNGKVNHTRIIPFNSPKLIGGLNPYRKSTLA